ncbi:hypothetical protein [Spongiibacter sp. IMCC21906]|jgi:hypothetical protein|uniref:hypothetical protein n=1 Tax=Spongiibacter sp. IMCC21906 TaxID=1620392 RepID=UPI0018CE28D4|nr:hypothetical protein [Spongiibacter sp. IMCC21906]
MQIQSSLLLLVSFTFVFAPTLSQWLQDSGSAWYRHHLLWLVVIAFIYLSHRQKHVK